MTDLWQALDDYLRLRRSLGHQMAEAAYLLPDFVAFLDGRGERAVTIAAALGWVKAREPEAVTTVSPRRITAVRGFARYLMS
jgi:integrase/recombinase XerD